MATKTIRDIDGGRELLGLLLKTDYPTETIGSFYVSPRGRNPKRIVWRLSKSRVIFEDLFTQHNEYDRFIDDIKLKGLDTAKRFKGYTEMSIN